MKKKLIHFMNEHFWGLKQLETQTNEHFRLKKGGEKGPIFSKIYPYFSSKHQKIDSAGVFLLVFQALEVDHERINFSELQINHQQSSVSLLFVELSPNSYEEQEKTQRQF